MKISQKGHIIALSFTREDCRLGAHIAPEGFSGWNDRTDTCLARFAEAGSSGPGARQRPDWVAAPSAADAAALLARAGARGVDRVVPLGQALEMDTVWDGRDLIAALSRIIG